MKRILILTSLLINVLTIKAQTLQTYNGNYTIENTYNEGVASYQYYVKDGKRIKNGSFSFKNVTKITSCIITGFYKDDLKTGQWTENVSYFEYDGLSGINPDNLRKNYVMKNDPLVEVIETKQYTCVNGELHGDYLYSKNSTRKWYYPASGTSIYSKKRIEMYDLGKPISKTGTFIDEGKQVYKYTCKYKNGILNGKAEFTQPTFKEVCNVKNGFIISRYNEELGTGKKFEIENYNKDSVLFNLYNNKQLGVYLNDESKLYVDTFPGSSVLRYNRIYVKKEEANITRGTGYYQENLFKDIDLGEVYYFEIDKETKPITQIDIDNYVFTNWADEFKYLDQYFINKPNKILKYEVIGNPVPKKTIDSLNNLKMEFTYFWDLSSHYDNGEKIIDSIFYIQDTIYEKISRPRIRYLLAKGDTNSLKKAKFDLENAYGIYLYEYVYQYFNHNNLADFFEEYANTNNESTIYDVYVCKTLIAYLSKSNCPSHLIEFLTNKINKIEHLRTMCNKSKEYRELNLAVYDIGSQRWQANDLVGFANKHENYRSIISGETLDFYYNKNQDNINVCPSIMRLPTIQDIELYFESSTPINEVISLNNKTYYPKDANNIGSGSIILVLDNSDNQLKYYDVIEKKILNNNDIFVKVRCIVK